MVYTLLFVPISVGGALAVAMLLHARIRFSRFYRTAVFVPVATSTVATGIIFNWLLEPTYGMANYLLGKVGMGPYGFFQDPDQAMYSIVAMTVWGWLGFDVIIFLAALQGVPTELIEAAKLDGAGRWATFRRVTLPLLSPATLFLIVWSTINALQVFDEIYVTTRGGPLRSHDRAGLLHLRPGLRLLPRRLRSGDRLRVVPGHARVLAGPALDRPAERALQLVRWDAS